MTKCSSLVSIDHQLCTDHGPRLVGAVDLLVLGEADRQLGQLLRAPPDLDGVVTHEAPDLNRARLCWCHKTWKAVIEYLHKIHIVT